MSQTLDGISATWHDFPVTTPRPIPKEEKVYLKSQVERLRYE